MRVELEGYGKSLISRQRGAAIRNEILDQAPAADVIDLDFHGVRRASYSFVDELVGRLATLHEGGELQASLSLSNIEGITAFHAEQCLSRRLGEGFRASVPMTALA